jgi:hypothetical protein
MMEMCTVDEREERARMISETVLDLAHTISAYSGHLPASGDVIKAQGHSSGP